MAVGRDRIREVLAHHGLFADLAPNDLDRLVQLGVTRSFVAGEAVFSKGDPGEAMMAVLTGRVRISCCSVDGREMVFAVFGPGEVFGEIAMLDGGERTADAVAIEPTDLVIVRRRDFMPFLAGNTELCLKLLVMLCDRIRRTSEQIEDFSFLPVGRRLAKRLLCLADFSGRPAGSGVQITLPLSQQMLAGMMGTSREWVNKTLRTWTSDGLIDLDHGRIVIRDRAALERIVDGET
jgi:CRP-like cAMP-binding protein